MSGQEAMLDMYFHAAGLAKEKRFLARLNKGGAGSQAA